MNDNWINLSIRLNTEQNNKKSTGFNFIFICIFSISTVAQVTELEDTLVPTYNGDIGILEKIIRPKCLGCHTSQLNGESARNFAPEGVNFDTFEGAKQQGEKIVNQAVELMRMPPNSALRLNGNEKQTIKNCVVLGFPEDGMLHMMFKLSQCAEGKWRKLRGFGFLSKVIKGVQFKDGVEVISDDQVAA